MPYICHMCQLLHKQMPQELVAPCPPLLSQVWLPYLYDPQQSLAGISSNTIPQLCWYSNLFIAYHLQFLILKVKILLHHFFYFVVSYLQYSLSLIDFSEASSTFLFSVLSTMCAQVLPSCLPPCSFCVFCSFSYSLFCTFSSTDISAFFCMFVSRIFNP